MDVCVGGGLQRKYVWVDVWSQTSHSLLEEEFETLSQQLNPQRLGEQMCVTLIPIGGWATVIVSYLISKMRAKVRRRLNQTPALVSIEKSQIINACPASYGCTHILYCIVADNSYISIQITFIYRSHLTSVYKTAVQFHALFSVLNYTKRKHICWPIYPATFDLVMHKNELCLK